MINVLKTALKMIPPEPIEYYKFSSRAINDIGIEENTYSSAITIHASVQAVPRSMYEQLGLDLQKKFVTVYTAQNVIDVGRDTSGDKFLYYGETYLIESKTDWISFNKWNSFMAVRVD